MIRASIALIATLSASVSLAQTTAARTAAAQSAPTAPMLATRRDALIAFGLPASEPAMRLGERASERCGRAPGTTICAIAAAAYDLAAARAEFGAAEALARATSVPPVRLEGARGLAEARLLVPALAAQLDALERRIRTVTGAEAEARTTLARLLTERLRTEGSTIRTLARVAEGAPAPTGSPLARAQALVDAAIEESVREDDAYVGRTRRSSAGSRSRDRAAAAAAIAHALPARITSLPEPDRGRYLASLEAAGRLSDADARLDALLDLMSELDARGP